MNAFSLYQIFNLVVARVMIMKVVMVMFVESMYSNNCKSYQVNVLESLAHIIPEVSIIMQLKSYSYSRLITI